MNKLRGRGYTTANALDHSGWYYTLNCGFTPPPSPPAMIGDLVLPKGPMVMYTFYALFSCMDKTLACSFSGLVHIPKDVVIVGVLIVSWL